MPLAFPLPLTSSVPAAIALAVVYGVLSTFAYGYFAVWAYSPYLSAALGAGGKFLGFLMRVIFLKNGDINVYAASTVFITAGMSACTSAQASVLGDWFQHSSAAQRLGFHKRRPRALPALCKLMSLAVLIFGPVVGSLAAILMYGVKTPSSVSHALRLRKWSAWGTLACLAVLSLLALLAVGLACLRPAKGARRNGLVATVLLSLCLILLSGAARVRNLYDSSISLDDSYYYTLIVLPELLQQLLALVPALLHRTGLADSYTGWRMRTWGWVGRAFPPAPAEAEQVQHAQQGAAAGRPTASASVSTKSGLSAWFEEKDGDCNV